MQSRRHDPPEITLTNIGTAPTGGPVQVALVASTTKNFTVGSSVVALYDITTSIPAASQVATGGHDRGLQPDTAR